MVMAATGAADEPVIDHHIALPIGSRPTNNLCGCITPTGPRRMEIRQRLAGYHITPTNFPEYVQGTRFNLRYMQSVSDIIGKYEIFRIEEVCFPRLTLAGGESQIITTRPIADEGLDKSWTETTVQSTSAGCDCTKTRRSYFNVNLILFLRQSLVH